MIIAMGFALFAVAVKYLPIFPAQHVVEPSLPAARRPRVVASGVLEHVGD